MHTQTGDFFCNCSIRPGNRAPQKNLDTGSRFKPGTSFAGMTNESRSVHARVIPAEAGIQEGLPGVSDLPLIPCIKKQENVPAKIQAVRLAMGLSSAGTEL